MRRNIIAVRPPGGESTQHQIVRARQATAADGYRSNSPTDQYSARKYMISNLIMVLGNTPQIKHLPECRSELVDLWRVSKHHDKVTYHVFTRAVSIGGGVAPVALAQVKLMPLGKQS